MLLCKLGVLMNQVTDAGATGGGGGGAENITIDIDKASDQIGADLGLGSDKKDEVVLDDDATRGSATPSLEKPRSAPLDTPAAKARAWLKDLMKEEELKDKKDEDVLNLEKEHRTRLANPPKAWKAEMHPRWKDLPAAVQNYVLAREGEVETGFKQYGEKAKLADAIGQMLAPYKPLLDSQGLKDPIQTLNNLMVAHNVLSTQGPDKGAALLLNLAKNYKIGPDKLLALLNKPADQPQETAAEKELRLRMEALENDRKEEVRRNYETIKSQVATEVEKFKADPAHPYYDEVAAEIALHLADPRVSLKEAYERACWSNPVVREKVLADRQKATEEAARKKAEEEAAAAKKARGTTVRGKDTERPQAGKLGNFEDTMRETLAEIKGRDS